MKKTIFAIVALALVGLMALPAQAQQDFGVGVMAGEPTGINLKKWIGNDRAIDAGLAWSFSDNDSFHLHADYLVHRFDLLKAPEVKGQIPLYFGIGGRVKFEEDNGRRDDDDDVAGIRIPLGISYMFSDAPVDIFGEIAPVVDIVPDTELDLNAAIGARLYF